MSIKKELAELHDEAERQGFRLEEGSHGIKVFPPDPSKPMFVSAKTPSDRRALYNIIAKFRRAGLQWPPKTKREKRAEGSK